jgi:hypothetical protein
MAKIKIKEIAPLVSKMIADLEEIKTDAEKFDKGTMAAGTRIRVALQDIKLQIKIARDDVAESKEARKAEKSK